MRQPDVAGHIRGGIAALDQATGNRLATWYSVPVGQLGGSVWSTPAVAADGSVFVTTGDAVSTLLAGDSQSIVRLDPNTLARLDGYQLVTGKDDSDFGGSPTLFTATLDGVSTPMVTACNKNGYYYGWKADALSAGPVWNVPGHASVHDTGECDGGAVWDGSNLYVGGASSKIGGVFYRGSMSKLDPATGVPIWVTPLPEAIRTYPSIDGAGALVAASFDVTSATNHAFLFNASTGTYRARRRRQHAGGRRAGVRRSIPRDREPRRHDPHVPDSLTLVALVVSRREARGLPGLITADQIGGMAESQRLQRRRGETRCVALVADDDDGLVVR